jgi:hypothetical protein
MEKELSLLLSQLYPDFNDRNIEQIMPHFAVYADWPNGMTGGGVVGHDAIRDYWTNQWSVINSKVTPLSYRLVEKQIILEVHQLVKDTQGETLSNSVVHQTYDFQDGKITKMNISEEVPEFGELTVAIPV